MTLQSASLQGPYLRCQRWISLQEEIGADGGRIRIAQHVVGITVVDVCRKLLVYVAEGSLLVARFHQETISLRLADLRPHVRLFAVRSVTDRGVPPHQL